MAHASGAFPIRRRPDSPGAVRNVRHGPTRRPQRVALPLSGVHWQENHDQRSPARAGLPRATGNVKLNEPQSTRESSYIAYSDRGDLARVGFELALRGLRLALELLGLGG